MSVRFTWLEDRWAHDILVGRTVCWQSVEGPDADGGDPRWPASPVFVELSRLHTARGPVLLGVGRAGRSHFSASIEADPAHPDRLRFEVACRVQELPARLGSTYRGPGGAVRVAPATAAPPPPATVVWAYAASPGGIVALGETWGGEGPASRED